MKSVSRVPMRHVALAFAVAFGGLAACSSDGDSGSGSDTGSDTGSDSESGADSGSTAESDGEGEEGESEASGDGSQTITILSSWTTGNATGDQVNKNVEAFTADTGIKVDIQEVNNDDVDEVFEASALANEQPDLVILNFTSDSLDWLPQGLVSDAGSYMDEWGIREAVSESSVDYWTNDAGVNGFPYIGFNWPIWYNTDLLTAAGVDEVPATYEDLLVATEKLRAADIQPFALGGKDWTAEKFISHMAQQFVEPADMEAVFADGNWCQADVVKGLELLVEMRDNDVFIDNVAGYGSDEMGNAYYTGEAAMMPAGSWAYTSEAITPELAAATKLGGFPVVEGSVYDKPTAYQGHSAGFFITPSAEDNIDAVRQFMQYMYSPEVMQGWVGEASQILDAAPDRVAGATSSAPLVLAGAELGDSNTDWVVLPDGFFPAHVADWGATVASAFLGDNDATAEDLCAAIEDVYDN